MTSPGRDSAVSKAGVAAWPSPGLPALGHIRFGGTKTVRPGLTLLTKAALRPLVGGGAGSGPALCVSLSPASGRTHWPHCAPRFLSPAAAEMPQGLVTCFLRGLAVEHPHPEAAPAQGQGSARCALFFLVVVVINYIQHKICQCVHF